MVILTNADGRPFEEPPRPEPDATIEEKISWLRARAAWRDAVADCANQTFAEAFSKGCIGTAYAAF